MNAENELPTNAASGNENDWFLQQLVDMVNRSKVEIGITLQVSGLLVSGNLVSGDKYFNGFAEEFSIPFKNNQETADSIKEGFSKYGDIYTDIQNGSDHPPPQFIHLNDTRFFNTSGNPIPANRGVWWRGRISQVGGFSLGTLSSNSN